MMTNIETSDLIMSLLVTFGILQLAWFSVMIVRRGVPPQIIQHSIPALLTIWVLMWPVYIDERWIWVGIIALFLPSLLAFGYRKPFWQHLAIAWTPQPENNKPAIYSNPRLLPLTQTMAALAVACLWFQAIPEFGFGLALCICLAFPAAHWVDHLGEVKFGFLKLGFPAHPGQTLAGHLALIATSTALLCWGLHVYHGTDWQTLFIATLIASMTASAARALIPGEWNVPAAVLCVGFTMWLL